MKPSAIALLALVASQAYAEPDRARHGEYVLRSTDTPKATIGAPKMVSCGQAADDFFQAKTVFEIVFDKDRAMVNGANWPVVQRHGTAAVARDPSSDPQIVVQVWFWATGEKTGAGMLLFAERGPRGYACNDVKILTGSYVAP